MNRILRSSHLFVLAAAVSATMIAAAGCDTDPGGDSQADAGEPGAVDGATSDGRADSPDAAEVVWQGDGFVVDHTSVALFEQIPTEYIEAARDIRMVFSDRSVGQNINEALDCLTADTWASSPAYCRRHFIDDSGNYSTFNQADLDAGRVPEVIRFDPDPVLYDRSNWDFELRAGNWSSLTEDFITSLAPMYLPSKDVITYQFSYLNVDGASDIADPDTGFFADTPESYDIHDLEVFFAENPDKVFFLWTASLARSIGTEVSRDFNQAMREYAAENGHVLFDVAAIESHLHDGTPCYDNRDGVEYCTGGGECENHPDDGLALPAICQDYTTELEGGHLGSVSGAKIRIAKGYWVLMARLAGWDPDA